MTDTSMSRSRALQRGTLLGLLVLAVMGVVAWLLWLEQCHTLQPYSRIEDRLYLGGAVAQPPPGTTAVLNLCDTPDLYRMKHTAHIPLEGSTAPSIEQLENMIAFIDRQRQQGETVFVHCLAGMNRSGMVMTAYLMYEHGWTRDQALAFVQARRPQVQPNPTMMRLLTEWEQARGRPK